MNIQLTLSAEQLQTIQGALTTQHSCLESFLFDTKHVHSQSDMRRANTMLNAAQRLEHQLAAIIKLED